MNEKATVEEPWMEAARNVLWGFDVYRNARNPLDAAHYLVSLNNEIAQLATWMPEYDYNRGWLVGEGDDA